MADVQLSDLRQPLLGELFQRSGGEFVSVADIEAAITDAPATTRAKVRGEAVKKLSGRQDVSCSWVAVSTPEQQLILDEPFETCERWRAVL